MKSAEVPIKVGDVLDGKYRVERLLGVGGMGLVVQARHIDLNTRFAIKLLLPGALADAENIERFQREAKAAVQLKSEHTARVTDVGRLRDGTPYMVMELLVGKDLGTVLEDSGALPHDEAIDLVLQACEAIAEAHALGIVHRDLKPRNLFLGTRLDGRPLIKVLDFGLAKHIEENGDHALTRTTAVMGSPQYMSPEQMRASRDVDGRTDIWSLGVCLYELVTGDVPFEAPTVPALCATVLKDPARPPHDVKPDLPRALSSVVMRCLEKNACDRFANVADLADALEPFASPSSRGSAARVRHVLTSPRRMDSERPPMPSDIPLPISQAASMRDPTGETRTASAFDPQRRLQRERSPRAYGLAVAGAAGGFLLLGAASFAAFARAPKAHGVAVQAPALDLAPTSAPVVAAIAAVAPPSALPAPVIPDPAPPAPPAKHASAPTTPTKPTRASPPTALHSGSNAKSTATTIARPPLATAAAPPPAPPHKPERDPGDTF